MRTLSIIIPCYNEEDTISIVLEKILDIRIPGWNIEVVVVDDCSVDNSRNILKEFESRIKVIYGERNKGKGSVVKSGLEIASGHFILIQDADLEYFPEEIIFLIKAIRDENSVVYGSRNLKKDRRKGSFVPRVGVWFLTKLINILYGAKLTDVWTCYKLFPHHVKDLFVVGRFESEIIFTLGLLRRGHKIHEVSISYNPRDIAHGKKIRYRDGLIAIWLVLKDRFMKKIW